MFRQAAQGARALLGRLRPAIPGLEAAAIEVEVIDAGGLRAGRAGIALPGQLDRVRAVAFGRPVADEIREFQGENRQVAATTRYLLRDAVIRAGRLRCAGGAKWYRNREDLALEDADLPMIEHEEAALRTSFVGMHFFGHWLRDDCATQYLAAGYGPVLAMATPPWPDKPAYRALLAAPYREIAGARADRLHIFDDIGQNEHKVARFRQSRALFAARAGIRSRPPFVYIARGPGGKGRRMVNEAQIIAALERRGVLVLQAEGAPVPVVVEALQGARMLISVEGSQISHGLLTLADGAGVLAIQPPDRFFNSHRDWSHALDMHYAVVVGSPAPGGFSVSEDELLETIDLLDRAIG